jgi:hypothetical protein
MDDPNLGMPDQGTVQGRYWYPGIRFVKTMPVGYLQSPEGKRMTFVEYLASLGHQGVQTIPHPPIYYRGKFSDRDHAQGSWLIEAERLPVGQGRALNFLEVRGTWIMERVG